MHHLRAVLYLSSGQICFCMVPTFIFSLIWFFFFFSFWFARSVNHRGKGVNIFCYDCAFVCFSFNDIHFYFTEFEAVRQPSFTLFYLPGGVKLLFYGVILFASSSVKFSVYLNNLPADGCIVFMYTIVASVDNDRVLFVPGLMLWFGAPAPHGIEVGMAVDLTVSLRSKLGSPHIAAEQGCGP